MAMLEGDYELAISSLENAAEFAIRFDTLIDKTKHTSVLVNRLDYDALGQTKIMTLQAVRSCTTKCSGKDMTLSERINVLRLYLIKSENIVRKKAVHFCTAFKLILHLLRRLIR